MAGGADTPRKSFDYDASAGRDSFEQRFPAGKSKILRGGGATETAFRQAARHYRTLHVATHGFFAPPEVKSALDRVATGDTMVRTGTATISGLHPGLLSGLVLAGANRPPELDQDDGILTALEVGALDLKDVDLVVLSACETGLGTIAGGEGILGLQRAFQVAGARSVVTSLWSIDDEATRKLMERFYENLWQKNLAKIDALREAQLWMLREGTERGLVRLKDDDIEPRIAPPFLLGRLRPQRRLAIDKVRWLWPTALGRNEFVDSHHE